MDILGKENPNLAEIENLEAKIAVRLNEAGWEVPDPTPLTLPSGFRRPETLQEQVRRLVRSTVSQIAADQGVETFEDSEDFDVDDDFDPNTPYEVFFDPALNREVSAEEFNRNHEIYKKRYLKAQEQYYNQMDAEEIIHDNLLRRKHQEKAGAGGKPAESSSVLPKAEKQS